MRVHFMRLSRAAGLAVMFVGALVLVGWLFDLEVLKRGSAGFVSMKINTAVAFLLAGCSLRAASATRSRSPGHRLASVAAVAVVIISTLTFSQYLTGRDLGIDQLLGRDTDTIETVNPGRMAPVTAVNFVLLGCALILLLRASTQGVAQLLALASLASAFLALIGYAYGLRYLYGVGPYTSMAVHTAGSFAVLALGIMGCRPDAGFMARVSDQTPGALIVRRLIPLTLVMLSILGWLRLQGERAGLYDAHFGMAVLVLSSSVVIAGLIWHSAGVLDRVDRQRREAEDALRRVNSQLEARVEERGRELAKANEAFRAVVETAQDTIICADHRGLIIAWNRAAALTFGYPNDEVLGQPLTLIMPERFRSAHEAGLRRFTDTGVSRVIGSTLELVGLHKSGEEFPLELSLASWKADGQTRITAIIRDITHRKRAEETLRATNARLQELIAFKDDLVAKVGHELRTPLTAVREGVELVLDHSLGPTTPEQDRFLSAVIGNIDRLIELVSAMLDLSKIEAGRLALSRGRIALKDVVETVLGSYRALAGRRTLTAESSDVPDVFADANRVIQVLNNLISNAIKFTPDEGRITVRLSHAEPWVSVSVCDNGIGIAEADIRKLFQKFSQVGDGQATQRGTGLGLAVCKELIELHGGTIVVDSTPGRGSTFTCTLPVYSPERAVDACVEQRVGRPDQAPLGLLLLELPPEAVRAAHALDEAMGAIRSCLDRDDHVLSLGPRHVVVLASTDAAGLQAVSRRLRPALTQRLVPQASPGRLRIGAATHPADGTTARQLLAAATQRLNTDAGHDA